MANRRLKGRALYVGQRCSELARANSGTPSNGFRKGWILQLQDVRPFDILGRWSENQFLVIMINVKKKAMLMLGERMRALIENSDFKAGKASIKLTFSQSSVLIGNDVSNEELIEKLEELLKKSIEAGGNRSSYHVF